MRSCHCSLFKPKVEQNILNLMFEIKGGCNVQLWWKLGSNIQQQQLFTPVLALLLNRKGFTGQTCAQTTGCVKFSDFDNWALSHSCICSSLTSTHCSKTTPPTPPTPPPQPPEHLHSNTAPVPDEKYILEFNEKY